MLTSSGWSWSVQLAGTRTKRMLFSHSISQNAYVTCSLNSSNIVSAAWSSVFLSSLCLLLTKGIMILQYIWSFSFITPVVVRMSDMSVVRDLEIGMTLICTTLVYKFYREKFTCKCISKHSRELPLVIKPFNLNTFSPLLFHRPVGALAHNSTQFDPN